MVFVFNNNVDNLALTVQKTICIREGEFPKRFRYGNSIDCGRSRCNIKNKLKTRRNDYNVTIF